jgi:hypothetical protein
MAQAFDYFGDSKDALRMLIPVMINEKNVAMREKRLDEATEMQKRQLELERDKLDETKKAKLQDWRLRSLSGMAEKFIGEGDTENLKKLAPAFQEFGIDLTQLIPGEVKQKAPTSAAGLAWTLGGGDPTKTLDAYRKMHPQSSDKSVTADEFLMGKANGDVNEFIRLKGLLERGKSDARGGDEKVPPAVKMAFDGLKSTMMKSGNNSMVALGAILSPGTFTPDMMQSIQGGVDPQLKPMVDQWLKIVTNWTNEKAGVAGPGAAAPEMGDDPLGLRKNSR